MRTIPSRRIRTTAYERNSVGRALTHLGSGTSSPYGSVAVLVSGGIESAAMLQRLGLSHGALYPIYVRAGFLWERAELHWLRRLLRALRRPALKPLACLELPAGDCYPAGHWSLSGRRVPDARSRDEAVYLPGRNALLLAKAATFCAGRGIGSIALGVLSTNPFPDGSPRFLRLMARALSAGLGVPLRVIAPLAGLDKARVIRASGDLPWELTFSCIRPKGLRHCGRCNKCAERNAGLAAARLR
ncbi:MAG: 7-cyano-7-deazaguanine synthase [Elusimicrobiota bacterium]